MPRKTPDLNVLMAAHFARTRAGSGDDGSFWRHLVQRSGQAIQDPYSEHSGVFGAIRALVNHLISVPIVLFRGTGDDARLVEAGPWFDFFRRPSSEFTTKEILTHTWTYAMTGGEAMWVLYGRNGLIDERSVPVEVQVLPGPLFTDKTRDGMLTHWEYRPPGGSMVRLETWQVLNHRPVPRLGNPRRGMSPLAPIRRAIRSDDMAARYNEAFLGNDATPGGILSTDTDISVDQAKKQAELWRDQQGGPNKSGKTAVLGNGVKFQPIGTSHKDMEYLGQREWTRREISEATGVPPPLLGNWEAVHSKESARSVLKSFWEGTLIPYLVGMQATLNERLFARRVDGENLRAVHDLVDVEALQEEQGARRENAAKDRALGVPLNEVVNRHDLGYEDQGESGDVGLVAFSLQTVDMAAGTDLPPEPEPAPPPPEAPPPAPPAEEDEPDDEDADEDDEENGRAFTATRRSDKRERMAREYSKFLAHHQGKMRTALRRKVFKTYRRETLEMVEKAAREIDGSTVDEWLAKTRGEWDELMADQTRPATENVIEATLQRAETQIGASLQHIDMTSPAVLEIIAESGARKVKAVGTVQDGIRKTLLQGSAEGEGLHDLQARIKRLFNQYDAAGSLRIARTETAAASTKAKNETLIAEGIKQHEWLSSGGPNVRDSHMIDGEIVDIGTPFSNGLMYPLDPNGPAEEVINCACEALPVV